GQGPRARRRRALGALRARRRAGRAADRARQRARRADGPRRLGRRLGAGGDGRLACARLRVLPALVPAGALVGRAGRPEVQAEGRTVSQRRANQVPTTATRISATANATLRKVGSAAARPATANSPARGTKPAPVATVNFPKRSRERPAPANTGVSTL